MKSINVKVQLEKKGKATDLAHIVSKLEKLPDDLANKFLNEANKNNSLKNSLLNRVREKLAATNVFGPTTNLYKDVKVTAKKNANDLSLTCRVPKTSKAFSYFKIWNFGGTVVAKKADVKFLTVPFEKESYKSPLEFDTRKSDSLFSFVTPRSTSTSMHRIDKSGTLDADVRGTLFFAKKPKEDENGKTQKVPRDVVAKFLLVRKLSYKGLHWIEKAQKEFVTKDIPRILKESDLTKGFKL